LISTALLILGGCFREALQIFRFEELDAAPEARNAQIEIEPTGYSIERGIIEGAVWALLGKSRKPQIDNRVIERVEGE
jgi:hypothetical protein